ncbi:MAG: hypothetical protein JJU45_18530 [Acidimicrobiia bacterium]|nr:hypothetical protein [Acidimicrobiia bacterium]
MALRHSHQDRFPGDSPNGAQQPRRAAGTAASDPSVPLRPSAAERLWGLTRAGLVSVAGGLALAALLTAAVVAMALLAVNALS